MTHTVKRQIVDMIAVVEGLQAHSTATSANWLHLAFEAERCILKHGLPERDKRKAENLLGGASFSFRQHRE